MERWSKLKIGTDVFVGKFDRNNSEAVESFTFWLSDFKTLWSECVNSKENLLQRLVDDNPALVINDETPEQLLSALKRVGSAAQMNTGIKPGEKEFKLKLNLSLGDGIPSQFHWLLKKCEPQMFFDQITKSMLYQIGEYSKVIDIIKKKDDEIKQRKLEGAPPLVRTKFETEIFNADEFALRSQMFDCTIDDLESIIGPLFKSEAKQEMIVPKNPTVVPNRSARHRMRLLPQELIKPGVVTYVSDDDEDESASDKVEDQIKVEEVQNTPNPTIPSPKKRFRSDFKV